MASWYWLFNSTQFHAKMSRCLCLIIFLNASIAFAQLTPQQCIIENNQIVLAPQELEVLNSYGLIDSLEMQQLKVFYFAGGQILNLYQLQGLLSKTDPVKLQALLPFLLLPAPKLSTALAHFDVSTLQFKAELRVLPPSFQNQQQYWSVSQDTNYLGSPFSFDWRCQLSVSNWRFGSHIAKDAGEPFWHQGKNGGFDFLSAFAAWKNPNNLRVLSKMLLGSYQLQWGQGLQLWTSRGLGKSIDLLQLVRNPQGLQPYQSNDEQRFLQGAAIQLHKAPYELLLFGSYKFTDTKSPIDSNQVEFNFSYTSGYHRTAMEIARRRLLQEQLLGIAFSKSGSVFRSGIMLLYQQARLRLSIADTLDSAFQMMSAQLLSTGLYARGTWRQFYFYGEAVLCSHQQFNLKQKSAINLALVYFCDPKIEIGIHLRNYGSSYKAFYANPIGNSSLGVNERGLIMQYKCQLRRYTVLRLLSEWTTQPFINHNSKFPVTKHEIRLQYAHQSSRKNSFDCQLARRSLNALSSIWQAQFNLTLLPLKGQELDLTAQLNFNDKAKKVSLMMALGWRYSPMNKALRWELKYGLYQNNLNGSTMLTHFYLLGVGSQTFALNGVGAFALAAFRWTINTHWQVQLHGIYSTTYTIPNRQKIQIGALFRYQF